MPTDKTAEANGRLTGEQRFRFLAATFRRIHLVVLLIFVFAVVQMFTLWHMCKTSMETATSLERQGLPVFKELAALQKNLAIYRLDSYEYQFVQQDEKAGRAKAAEDTALQMRAELKNLQALFPEGEGRQLAINLENAVVDLDTQFQKVRGLVDSDFPAAMKSMDQDIPPRTERVTAAENALKEFDYQFFDRQANATFAGFDWIKTTAVLFGAANSFVALCAVVFVLLAARRSHAQLSEALARLEGRNQELHYERELWQMLLDTSPDHIYFKDAQSRFIKSSKAQARQFGVASTDEMVGKTDFDFFDEAHARPAFEDEQEIVRTGRPMIAKEELEVWKDGHVTWASSTKLPLRDSAGKIIGIMGISRDITERKEVEEAMRQSEEKYRALIETTNTGFLILDAHGKVIDANQEYVRLAGYDALEEILGRSVTEWTAPYDLERNAGEVKKCAAQGFIRNVEIDYVNRSGQITPIEINATVMGSGGSARILSLCRDITDRKLADQKLREAFDFNQKIILDAPLGIVAYKASGPCMLANEAAAKMLRATASQLLEQDFRKIASWRNSGMLRVAEEVLATKESRQCESNFVSTFGKEVSLMCHFSHFVQNGEPHLLLIFNDITEKKKMEAQFLRAQRMESIGTLAGGIAHDLNNVLSPLLISIQLLKDQITAPSGQKLLETLEANVNRGTSLVRQVLAFGRGIKGDHILVQVQHIAREISQIIQETFPKSLRFQLDLASGLWPVSCDPNQVHQVLLNLCVNARDAMPQGGKLSLRMENVLIEPDYVVRNLDAKPGPYVVISVEDTGTGISSENQEHIFEPFFTTKDPGKGTGLGLSTTLAIIKSHDGFIHCYSEPDKGSIFKVYLPADTTSVAGDAGPEKQRQLPRGHNELVLVVDDEEPIRNLVQRTLERFGYRVLLAANGAEAVALYNKSRWREIAVVITDMAMPVMDGPTAITALRTLNPKIKIIGSSGLDSGVRRGNQTDTDIRHFLVKPYTTENLLQTLQAILQEDAAGHSTAEQADGNAVEK